MFFFFVGGSTARDSTVCVCEGIWFASGFTQYNVSFLLSFFVFIVNFRLTVLNFEC